MGYATGRDNWLEPYRRLIGRRPIVSFFVLAFALSWLAWIPYVLSRSGLGVLDFDFPVVLGTTQLMGMMPGAYLGPILSAFLVTLATYGRAGVREWFGRFLRWRVGWRWYAGVIGGVPLVLTVVGLLMASGEHSVEPVTMAVVLSYLPLLALQMLTTGLAEEPGWRDFALPQLQPRFGPLGANMILGPLWGCWHLPLFLTSWAGWPDVQISDVLEFIATAVALCIVMTWVSNKTRQSLPLQMILHSSINNTVSVIWGSLFPTMGHDEFTRGVLIISASIAVVLLVATRGRLGWTMPARELARI